MFARPLWKKEEFLDYNGRPPNLFGFISVDVQVGKRNMKKARLIIARDGKRSLIGRDWLAQLNFHAAEAKQSSEYKNIINNIENKVELSLELKRIKQKFRKSFC